MNYLIRNAYVVNEGEAFKADVLTDNGIISKVVREGAPGFRGLESGARVIDATGKYLIPGIIDEHVHFREPGLTHKADIGTESRAALAGGVTSFMDMPNTLPATVTAELLEEKFRIAEQKSLANYSFYIGATNDNLKEILNIDPAKVCGIKLFMGSSTGDMLVDSNTAIEALFSEAPCIIAAHCEDERTIRDNTEKFKALAASGKVIPNASIHPQIRSNEACFIATERAVNLAAKTGARLHVLHISSSEELRLFQDCTSLEQKKITAETCPHYLFFDDSFYKEMGYSIKCNPAIKSSRDRIALMEALKSGRIDTIGSDHAPHLPDEKNAPDCFSSKSGFPSIQHGLEIMNEVGLGLADVVRLMCHNPAILYGVDRRGFIREGYHADLAIVDMGSSRVLSDVEEFTRCGWSPYNGRNVSTRVTHTFVNGNLIFENGVFNESFRGERLTFKR